VNIFVRILQILLAIAFVVLAYYVIIYVLGLLGIRVPEQILTVIFVIMGLMIAIGVFTGRFDNINWWGPRAGP
jgi:hypothetical protein